MDRRRVCLARLRLHLVEFLSLALQDLELLWAKHKFSLMLVMDQWLHLEALFCLYEYSFF